MRLLAIVLLSCCMLYGCIEVVEPIEIDELQSLTTEDKEEEQESLPKENKSIITQNETIVQSETSDETLQTIEQYFLNGSPIVEEFNFDKTKIYYLALGDSLTRGVGDEEKKNGYTERLAEKIEEYILNSEVILDNRGSVEEEAINSCHLLRKATITQS